jgi:hypothetical protein
MVTASCVMEYPPDILVRADANGAQEKAARGDQATSCIL